MSALAPSNLVGLLMAKVLVRGSGVIITLMLPRFWAPEEYGVFASVFSLVLLLEALAPAGTHYTILRQTARLPSSISHTLKRAWRLAGPVTASLAVCLTTILMIVPFVTPTLVLVSASATLLLLRTPLWLYQAYFQGLENSRPIAIGATLDGAVKIVGLILVVASSGGVAAMLLTLAFGRATAVAFLWVFMRSSRAPAALSDAHGSAPPASRSAASEPWVDPLLEFDVHFTQFIVALLFSAAAAAYFKIAAALLTLAAMVGYALNEALIPRMARLESDRSPDSTRSLEVTCTLHTIAGVGAGVLLAVASPLIPVVFGASYAAAVGPTVLLALLAPARFWALGLGNFYLSRDATSVWTVALASGAAVVATVGVVAVPRFGTWGGAAAVGAGQVAQFAYLAVRTSRSRLDFSPRSFLRVDLLVPRTSATN